MTLQKTRRSSNIWEHVYRAMTLAAMHLMVSLYMELCIWQNYRITVFLIPDDGIIMGTMEKVICLVEEGKPVDVGYLNSTETFDIVSHSIFLEKLATHGLSSGSLWLKQLT
ncbi:hypothetical protein DUI87_03866 [Hirundo rustica rustica]|uniref:Uncharacterized protein n=1 Tax=Hirundo rustica rustica TaxID=333673 RepID=A0A3M0L8E7_HIRRU|nr:hypothetical protein DUI87_03866 [Hirundo rustica rustica]